MTPTYGRGLLHLAAAVDLPEAYDAARCTESARLAESGGLDFVTLGDGADRPGPDALTALSGVAPRTSRIGLVPTVARARTRTEADAVRAAVAALDRASRGRAGWRQDRRPEPGPAAGHDGPPAHPGGIAGFTSEDAGSGPGRPRSAEGAGSATGAAGHAERVPGPAGAGDPGPAGEGAGPDRGGPRSPQGRPVRVVDVVGAQDRESAARCADVALVPAANLAQAAAVREQLRALAAGFGRAADPPLVLASLYVDLGAGEHVPEPGWGHPLPERGRGLSRGREPGRTGTGPLYRGGPVDLADLIADWHGQGGVDGFHLIPVEPRRDLERLVNGTVALLQHRGLFRTFYPGGTLREHLGLADRHDRYAVTGGG